jgi:RNA recognition motif-containing protein
MVTREELYDDREYDDILEDVKSECSQYGRVHSVVIPREKEGFPSASVGLIFVEFADPSMARDAAIALTGRKFAERTVMVDYVRLVTLYIEESDIFTSIINSNDLLLTFNVRQFDEIKFANRALA